MAKSTAPPQQRTQEIEVSQWIPFLAEFTRENRGAHGILRVMGADVGYQIQTEDRRFDGVSADVKDRTRDVWFSFGSMPGDRLTHGVQDATVIRVLPPTGDAGPIMEVEAKDGTKTILELSNPEAFALPPR